MPNLPTYFLSTLSLSRSRLICFLLTNFIFDDLIDLSVCLLGHAQYRSFQLGINNYYNRKERLIQGQVENYALSNKEEAYHQ